MVSFEFARLPVAVEPTSEPEQNLTGRLRLRPRHAEALFRALLADGVGRANREACWGRAPGSILFCCVTLDRSGPDYVLTLYFTWREQGWRGWAPGAIEYFEAALEVAIEGGE